jgi:hypothetical protein
MSNTTFSVSNTKLPQLTYSSANNKTSSYISQLTISTEHLNIIEHVENPESKSFISKPTNSFNYMNLLTFPQLSYTMTYNFDDSIGYNFFGKQINIYNIYNTSYIGFYNQEVIFNISGGSGNYSYYMSYVDQNGYVSPQASYTYATQYFFVGFPNVEFFTINQDQKNNNEIHFLFAGENVPTPIEFNSTTLIRLIITDTTTNISIPCPIILSWGPASYFGNNEIIGIDGNITNQDYTMSSGLLADSYDNTNFSWSSIVTATTLYPIGIYIMKNILNKQIYSVLADTNEVLANKIIMGEAENLIGKTLIITINDSLSSNAFGYRALTADDLIPTETGEFPIADSMLEAANIFRYFLP